MNTTLRFSAFFLILVLSSAITFAQRNADDLLKRVVDKTNAYKTLEVDFTYSMLNELAGIHEENEGKVYIKGDAYKLLVAGQQVISDGVTVWTYLEDSQEVMISLADDGEDAITPGKLLTSYYTDYKASFVNIKEDTDKGLKTIELKPVARKMFNKMNIAIDESKLQISNFSIFDSNGNTFVYRIKKMVPDVNLPATMFVFNPADYPNLEDIIDMR
jgi:outer membrane lipoprotein carrier protein